VTKPGAEKPGKTKQEARQQVSGPGRIAYLPPCSHIVLAHLLFEAFARAVMKHHRPAVFAAAFGLAVLVAPAAHAFTMDNNSNTKVDGSARYTDPDEHFSNSDGQTTMRQGNTTLQFGSRPSFEQRYDNSRMFDPLGRPGQDR
jgi:hypothetical protein